MRKSGSVVNVLGSYVGSSVGKEDICDIGKGEGMLVGKRVDLKIRKETIKRAKSITVRWFRDKFMFRKQDLVGSIGKKEIDSGLVDITSQTQFSY